MHLSLFLYKNIFPVLFFLFQTEKTVITQGLFVQKELERTLIDLQVPLVFMIR